MKLQLLPILTGIFLLSCHTNIQQEKLISVTIEPQRYFAEKIGGDNFRIISIVPSGQSPETYDPTPMEMVTIGKSTAWLRVGYIGFEQAWRETIEKNNPGMQVYDLSKGMDLISNEEECEHHSEGNIHHHHAGDTDPHIWSSVKGAKIIAQNTLNAFLDIDKENASYYQENYTQLLQEIEKTEKEINRLLTGLTNRTFIIYHPALTYFAAENNLVQLCIEMDGKEPSPAQLKRLVETARQHKAKIVFVQKEFDDKNAKIIADETGCKLVTINPLSYNWHEEMITIAKALADE
ncbi:MAG: zinc ABC transporter substrate-binding protein [Tannerellaceae bacterium]|nr:zinc ABC transporter substrate-binding protein [Tannerellaceae bacterium]